MTHYNFYGWKDSQNVRPISSDYRGITSPCSLYDVLMGLWCQYSCAPRMRQNWSEDNPTLGQCSITAFLAQDIFGGKVYGIPRPDGSYHCYNVVGGHTFDLTSEQFRGEALSYEGNPEQSREVHFSREEKRQRYEYLRSELKKAVDRL